MTPPSWVRSVLTVAATGVLFAYGAGTAAADRLQSSQQVTEQEHRHRLAQHGSTAVEEANRLYDEQWERWKKDLFNLPVHAGMTVADVGAGDGSLSVLLARAVGPSGHVFANEVENEKTSAIEKRRAEAGIDNMTVILGDEVDPCLPSGKVELAVMVEVFHHLTSPERFLARLVAELAPESTLVIIDPDVDQKWGHLTQGCRSDPQEARRLAEGTGLRFEGIRHRTVHDLDFYVLMLTKPLR